MEYLPEKSKKSLNELCGTEFSKSTISELCKNLDLIITAWNSRPLREKSFPFVIVDARCKSKRRGTCFVGAAY